MYYVNRCERMIYPHVSTLCTPLLGVGTCGLYMVIIDKSPCTLQLFLWLKAKNRIKVDMVDEAETKLFNWSKMACRCQKWKENAYMFDVFPPELKSVPL